MESSAATGFDCSLNEGFVWPSVPTVLLDRLRRSPGLCLFNLFLLFKAGRLHTTRPEPLP